MIPFFDEEGQVIMPEKTRKREVAHHCISNKNRDAEATGRGQGRSGMEDAEMQVKTRCKTRTRNAQAPPGIISSYGGLWMDGMMAVPKIDPKAEVIRLTRIQVGQGTVCRCVGSWV